LPARRAAIQLTRQSAVHCSQDYGNSEEDCTNPRAYCRGCMEAVYFGTGYGGGGKGPWIGADMEARPPRLQRCAAGRVQHTAC
jgi:hypothetical protein